MNQLFLCRAGLISLCMALLASFTARAQNNTDQEDWEQLFNGKDLTGWTVKIRNHELGDNYNNTFRVENGAMIVSYDQYDDFAKQYGHIFYEKPYSFYKIRVEYRFVGEQAPNGEGWATRNSGIMLHCQDPKTMAKEQDFPISIEFQLLGGLGKGDRPTANLCTPGTEAEQNGKMIPSHCISSSSKTYEGDQWVTVEAVVMGDSVIQHIVEGDTVLVYEKPEIGGGVVSGYYDWAKKDGTPLKEGYISLQSESHPIEFRKVEVLNLEGCTDPKAINYKSYYVKSDNSQCRY